jgi:hypothetical protein
MGWPPCECIASNGIRGDVFRELSGLTLSVSYHTENVKCSA